MDRRPPSWLDESFLATALQGGENKESRVNIVKFAAESAVPVGENYTSHLFRVQVTFNVGESADEQSESLIVKASISTGLAKELTEKWDFYELEPKVYCELLPKMFEKVKCHFGPKSFFTTVKSALVLKDMKAEGYVMCDRFKQLDYDHCKKVFECLGKYHATSVAIYHDEPELIENLGEERVYNDDCVFAPQFKPWIESSIRHFINVLNEVGGQQPMVNFLQSRVDQIWDSVVSYCKPKADHLNVMNHGDCWTNNMLFKHGELGDVVDVKLIDFQIPRYNSPVLDLTYFIWTSAEESVRENKLKDLFEIYLQTLNKTLEQLGCKERMTSSQLQEEIKLATDWVVLIICFMRIFIFCEPEYVIDIGKHTTEDFTNGVIDEKFRKIYNGRRYRDLLPGVTRDFKTWTSQYIS